MQPQPVSNATAIYQEIVAYMNGKGRPNDWYAGITGNVMERLFTAHKVSKDTHPAWIYRTCLNPTDARAIEAALHKLGCGGGGSGGLSNCMIVYAYQKVVGVTAP
jgi:hypothetical protein